MRPDTADAVRGDAGARLTELAALYAELDGRIAASAWPEVVTLLGRAQELIATLAQSADAPRTGPAAGDDAEMEIDALARAVIDGHARVLRNAEAARTAAAATLAGARRGRERAARYRAPGAPEAFFTSRTV